MIRLFVAIELPASVRTVLGFLHAGVPGARWTPVENMHLTLRFIGEVEEPRIEDIDRALLAVRSPRFSLELAGVGHFESAGQPRALWAGVPKIAPLIGLRDRIESALVRAGFAPEGRKFLPHVTLARLRDAPAPKVSAFLGRYGLFRAPPFPVDRFALFSSHHGRNGSTYRVEADYELAEEPRTMAQSRVRS
ncbi:MAG: RNA 2',3'-cyclic phosphodiesterase [Rhodospirillaceae bacterium]|nr:RNA 2',3'-cyclic phosphodiesterase [Rhodospirillaceae bacterium]